MYVKHIDKRGRFHGYKCITHKQTFRYFCPECRRESDRRMQEMLERRPDLADRVRIHRNDTCSACDKPIDYSEWLCYCSLCVNCFIKSDEEVDNYLGEPEQPKA